MLFLVALRTCSLSNSILAKVESIFLTAKSQLKINAGKVL